MAGRTHAQAKLNNVVQIIGEALTSEVCSIYLLRDGVLELYATRGLSQDAVHVTKLALGEGLVGTIAKHVETLNLDEAESHPEFAYKPETGEELYHSFAGVPIVRRERAVGVLCVQHEASRRYDDVEIEALQTVAMVLAELIAAAGLIDEALGAGTGARDTGPAQLAGLKLVDGMARGHAVYHQPRVVIEHSIAEDIEVERQRVYSAFRQMREQIDRMMSQAEFGTAGEHQDVLATYKMFAYDEGWSRADQRRDQRGADRRGGDRAGPAAHPPAHARDRRSVAARSDARSRGSVEPAAQDRLGPARHGGADGPPPGFDSHRAQSRARRAARI